MEGEFIVDIYLNNFSLWGLFDFVSGFHLMNASIGDSCDVGNL
jgi:hypothetical protein